MQNTKLLNVKNLNLYFKSEDGDISAISDLNFQLTHGETLCFVGESGCGKSLSALSLLRINPSSSYIKSGEINFEGENILSLAEKDMQNIRGKKISMIFQEPMTSLNPVLTIADQVCEPLILHLKLSKSEAYSKCIELFQQVGIADAEKRLFDYPHQLSGGMRQRVMIAMALACNPELLIADEPTTALDVTIQGQIIYLLKEQVKQRGMGLIFITHDLGLVAEIADNVIVMYAGEIVEYASAYDIFSKPLHPYTKGLMKAAPDMLSSRDEKLATIKGTVPPIGTYGNYCRFYDRCEFATPKCKEEKAAFIHLENGRSVRCNLYLSA